jgi:hypothetical protein
VHVPEETAVTSPDDDTVATAEFVFDHVYEEFEAFEGRTATDTCTVSPGMSERDVLSRVTPVTETDDDPADAVAEGSDDPAALLKPDEPMNPPLEHEMNRTVRNVIQMGRFILSFFIGMTPG